MKNKKDLLALSTAIVIGPMLWIVSAKMSGRREPWDSALYWEVSYPTALVLSGILGYAAPDRPWRWALAVMVSQFAAMAVKDGLGGMWPMGLALFGILSIPGMALAEAVGRFRQRHRRP